MNCEQELVSSQATKACKWGSASASAAPFPHGVYFGPSSSRCDEPAKAPLQQLEGEGAAAQMLVLSPVRSWHRIVTY